MIFLEKDPYTAKIFVQELHVAMNNFQGQEFIVWLFNCTAEVKTSIPMNIEQDIKIKFLFIRVRKENLRLQDKTE